MATPIPKTPKLSNPSIDEGSGVVVFVFALVMTALNAVVSKK